MKAIIRRCLAAVLCLLLAVPFCGTAETVKKNTVMIYMCGTDLETKNGQATRCIGDVVGSRFNTDAVNVVLLLGGARNWATGYDTETLTLLEAGGRRPRIATSFPDANMGDPETLTSFMDYVHENYPAERYDLVFWDHGGGPNWGVCHDQIHNDNLSMSEVVSALANSSFADEGLESIVFHACLMASAEVATMVAPYARYMVASEDAMYGLGYNWLAGLENDADGAATGIRIVDESFVSNGDVIQRQNATEKNSFTVVDLTKMDGVNAALDTFFEGIAANIDDAGLDTMSGGRRDSCAFGVGESGSSSDYDLVDLADLLNHYEGQDPAAVEAVQAALSEAVIYNLNSEGITAGLTVYHPYYNKAKLVERVSIYNTLGFSKGYTAYVQRFSAFLTGTPLADWTGLTTGDNVNRDNRVGFTMQLTEDQQAHYADSTLDVLRANDDGSYTFVYTTDRTGMNETGAVSGEFAGTALYAVDANNVPLTDALTYAYGEDERLYIDAEAVWASTGESDSVQLCCTIGEDGKALNLDSVRVMDPVTGCYTTIYNVEPESFSQITFTVANRVETEFAEGILSAYGDWTVTGSETYTLPVEGLSLRLLNDTIPTDELCATFRVCDTQNYTYSAKLLPMGGQAPQTGSMTVSYDDAELILVRDVNVNRTNGNLILTMSVTNLTDTEAFITLENLTVNGVAVAATGEASGSGDNWGLVDGEEVSLMAFASEEGIDAQLNEIVFDLTLIDAADESVIGTVPVTCALNMTVNG